MTILPIGFVVGLAFAGTLAALSGGGQHSHPARRTTVIAGSASAQTTAPAVPALISANGDQAGRYVAKPPRVTVVGGYLSSVKVEGLHWVDWGQPVAFASGEVLYQVDAGPSKGGYRDVRGGLMVGELKACGTTPRYYYSTFDLLSEPVQLDSYDSGPMGGVSGRLATPC